MRVNSCSFRICAELRLLDIFRQSGMGLIPRKRAAKLISLGSPSGVRRNSSADSKNLSPVDFGVTNFLTPVKNGALLSPSSSVPGFPFPSGIPSVSSSLGQIDSNALNIAGKSTSLNGSTPKTDNPAFVPLVSTPPQPRTGSRSNSGDSEQTVNRKNVASTPSANSVPVHATSIVTSSSVSAAPTTLAAATKASPMHPRFRFMKKGQTSDNVLTSSATSSSNTDNRVSATNALTAPPPLLPVSTSTGAPRPVHPSARVRPPVSSTVGPARPLHPSARMRPQHPSMRFKQNIRSSLSATSSGVDQSTVPVAPKPNPSQAHRLPVTSALTVPSGARPPTSLSLPGQQRPPTPIHPRMPDPRLARAPFPLSGLPPQNMIMSPFGPGGPLTPEQIRAQNYYAWFTSQQQQQLMMQMQQRPMVGQQNLSFNPSGVRPSGSSTLPTPLVLKISSPPLKSPGAVSVGGSPTGQHVAVARSRAQSVPSKDVSHPGKLTNLSLVSPRARQSLDFGKASMREPGLAIDVRGTDSEVAKISDKHPQPNATSDILRACISSSRILSPSVGSPKPSPLNSPHAVSAPLADKASALHVSVSSSSALSAPPAGLLKSCSEVLAVSASNELSAASTATTPVTSGANRSAPVSMANLGPATTGNETSTTITINKSSDGVVQSELGASLSLEDAISWCDEHLEDFPVSDAMLLSPHNYAKSPLKQPKQTTASNDQQAGDVTSQNDLKAARVVKDGQSSISIAISSAATSLTTSSASAVNVSSSVASASSRPLHPLHPRARMAAKLAATTTKATVAPSTPTPRIQPLASLEAAPLPSSSSVQNASSTLTSSSSSPARLHPLHPRARMAARLGMLSKASPVTSSASSPSPQATLSSPLKNAAPPKKPSTPKTPKTPKAAKKSATSTKQLAAPVASSIADSPSSAPSISPGRLHPLHPRARMQQMRMKALAASASASMPVQASAPSSSVTAKAPVAPDSVVTTASSIAAATTTPPRLHPLHPRARMQRKLGLASPTVPSTSSTNVSVSSDGNGLKGGLSINVPPAVPTTSNLLPATVSTSMSPDQTPTKTLHPLHPRARMMQKRLQACKPSLPPSATQSVAPPLPGSVFPTTQSSDEKTVFTSKSNSQEETSKVSLNKEPKPHDESVVIPSTYEVKDSAATLKELTASVVSPEARNSMIETDIDINDELNSPAFDTVDAPVDEASAACRMARRESSSLEKAGTVSDPVSEAELKIIRDTLEEIPPHMPYDDLENTPELGPSQCLSSDPAGRVNGVISAEQGSDVTERIKAFGSEEIGGDENSAKSERLNEVSVESSAEEGLNGSGSVRNSDPVSSSVSVPSSICVSSSVSVPSSASVPSVVSVSSSVPIKEIQPSHDRKELVESENLCIEPGQVEANKSDAALDGGNVVEVSNITDIAEHGLSASSPTVPNTDGVSDAHRCVDCSLSFESQSSYAQHIMDVHSAAAGEKRHFTCAVCSKLFKQRKRYEKHVINCLNIEGDINSVRTVDDPEAKPADSDKASSKSAIKTADFSCSRCSESFTSRIALKKHESTAHEKRGRGRPRKNVDAASQRPHDRASVSAQLSSSANDGQRPGPSGLKMRVSKKRVQFIDDDDDENDADFMAFTTPSRATGNPRPRRESAGTASYESDNLVCEHCGAVFRRTSSLNQHVISVHLTYFDDDEDYFEEAPTKLIVTPVPEEYEYVGALLSDSEEEVTEGTSNAGNDDVIEVDSCDDDDVDEVVEEASRQHMMVNALQCRLKVELPLLSKDILEPLLIVDSSDEDEQDCDMGDDNSTVSYDGASDDILEATKALMDLDPEGVLKEGAAEIDVNDAYLSNELEKNSMEVVTNVVPDDIVDDDFPEDFSDSESDGDSSRDDPTWEMEEMDE